VLGRNEANNHLIKISFEFLGMKSNAKAMRILSAMDFFTAFLQTSKAASAPAA
jgi:hypothetical protein